ncbi:quinone oxidoreductase [Tropicibacter sp. R16_0]|uniref:quinone oxidoreductase family protein n=1 Tax=Tropicibacter sp. R16_0 TaxID=2821102 RepID=UPI001AD9C2FC|nr:quinone oxidoreductase [Tropicibacter sp. R16_0]MBO9452224.1 quinone oxidoreductase [Tropicibacter sp. R16_0]
MSKAIVIRSYGGSEVLVCEDVDVGTPGAGQLRIRQTGIGVNYHDVYVRSGLYKTLALPGIPGCEATGVVEAVGPDVSEFHVGDRIAYVTGGYGAYASHRLLPADLAVPIPDNVADQVAASNLLRAMTVEMLTGHVCSISPGMTVLVHAAAGGVGRMLCQALASLGANVIGTVGSAEKADIARANGCSHTILYREVDFIEDVAKFTEGKGVQVVYDSVGADTFAGSLEALDFCGHLVNFGQSSGPIDPVAMATLATKSLTVSRPILFHYMRDPRQYRTMAEQALSKFASGQFQAPEPTPVPLTEASKAHEILESMTGGGSLVLVP